MADSTDDAAIRQFYDELFDRALNIVKAGKEHPPLVVSLERDGSKEAYLISCLPKDLAADFHQAIAARPNCVAAALIAESWYVERAIRTQPEEHRPCEHPSRKEGVLFYVLTQTQRAMLVCPINRMTRSMDKVPFKWIDESTNVVTGPLAGRVPRGTF